MVGFIGRTRELASLRKRLDRMASSGEGVALAVRGRRQVGKSRLVQEFCDAAGVPYVFFAATRGSATRESVATFFAELRDSGLPVDPHLVPTEAGASWPDAFRVLAAVLPDRPTIVVLDELPWLAEQDPTFDGALQTAWDRLLSVRPVFLLLLGSDLHMMERLTAYDRPFYGRADTLVLGPLDPAETGEATGLRGADAIDAHLISGGLPGILRAWPGATPPLDFIRAEMEDPASPVFGVPETALLAEFPQPDHARRVLEAVGTGDRTHASIAAAAGNGRAALPSGTLSPLLRSLSLDKQVIAVDEPLSTRPGKPALYRVADSNLRLYLGILRAAHEQTRRGHPAGAYRLFERRWRSWRGRAVEPLVREALQIAGMAGALPFPDVQVVGGWWNRRFDPEVDLVGADRGPVAGEVYFAGSVKWLEASFSARDSADLSRAVGAVPGFDPGRSGLVAVSLNGFEPDLGPVTLRWGPDDVLNAWLTGS